MSERAETGSYAPPEHVVKPAPNDTGYAMVKKAFKKILTWDDFVSKQRKPNLK